MPTRPPDDPAFTLNTTELATLLGVGRTTIYRMRDKGLLVADVHKRYTLAAVLRMLYESHTSGGNPDGPDLEAARRDLAVAQKEKIEMDMAERRKELLPHGEVDHLMLGLANILINGLAALAPRLGPVVAGLSDRPTIEAEVDRECDHLRAELADAIAAWDTDYRPHSRSDEAEPTDGPRPVGRRKPKNRRHARG